MSSIHDAEAWSQHSADYNPFFTGPLITSIFEKIFPLLDEALAKGPVKLLDTLCGGGAELGQLLKHYGPDGEKSKLGENLSIVATDFAPGMIEKLQEKVSAAASAVHGAVELKVADSQKLDLPDNTFQFALALFGPNFIQDSSAALKELNRVLAPGGVGLIATVKALDVYDIADAALKKVNPAATSVYDSDLVGKWGELSYVEAQLAAAGFAHIQGKVHETTAVSPDPESVLKSIKTNPAKSILYAGVTDRDAYFAAAQEATKSLGVDNNALKVSANVAFGIKA